MKVTYDREVDAIYLSLSHLRPQGVIEVAEGINIDVTEDGKIVGIELLEASEKIQIDTLLTYEIAAESIRDWVKSKDNDVALKGSQHFKSSRASILDTGKKAVENIEIKGKND